MKFKNFELPKEIKKNGTPSQKSNIERLDNILEKNNIYRKIEFHQFNNNIIMVSFFPEKWYDNLKIVELGTHGRVEVTVHYNDEEKTYDFLKVVSI